MKVLYISAGTGQDYLRDCLFHGLRDLLGSNVVDVNRLDSMYIGADRSQMYGKGMTLYAELSNVPANRDDIPHKIAGRYFDLVIYGSIHRCQDYLHEVTSIYPPSHIAYIDGEDHPGYLKGLPGHYFKRELHNPQPGVHPIQFAIPASKIIPEGQSFNKNRLMAPCDPIDQKTYIYKTEEDYYAQYAQSYFGATMKKAGWDCLRHYEIMSQRCMPYFRCLESCPPLIMSKLPKSELMLAKNLFEYFGESRNVHSEWASIANWEDLMDQVMFILRCDLTTAALARYVLETARCK